MKYIVLVGDGMADRPLKELGGLTPLQKAFTPNMDRLANEGIVGMAHTVPEGYSPGSDVANMSILGYNPAESYSGRAPLEAASMGVELAADDVAFRCNLVTLKYNKEMTKAYMEDYSAGHITSDEAAPLIDTLHKELAGKGVAFFPGVSYRHLMVWKNGLVKSECTPPHDITGREITDYLPAGEGAEFLQSLMRQSVDILKDMPFNKDRQAAGKNPANSIWLWGQGKRPSFKSFEEKYGIKGALVSAVDLMRGLAVCSGMKVLKVPGITGYLDTNYTGKAEYSLRALEEEVDFVYIHVEAPDEAGHMGKVKDKVRAIEDFDALVVGTIMRGIKSLGPCRILMMPDHPTPIEIKTHSSDPVPFVLYDSTSVRDNGGVVYDEHLGKAAGAVAIKDGHRLMDLLIKGKI